MTLQTIRTAVLSALVLASAALTFAANQSTGMHVPSKSEMQSRDGVTRAVQQGKGSGITRNQGVRANAYRSLTAGESSAIVDKSSAGRSRFSDIAFRK